MKVRILLSAGALCVGMLAASSVSAAILTFNSNAPTSGSAGAVPTTTTGTFFKAVTGSVDGVRKSPYEGTSFATTGEYHSVSALGSATYSFGSTQTFLSFIWGSPDAGTRNLIEFLGADGSVIDSYSASPPPATGEGFVNALFTNIANGAGFSGFRFSASQNAFEYAQVVTPIPAAGLLLLSGLLGLGWLRRRHNA